MKKILIGVITYIVFLVIYFLQSNFFNWFTIAGVSPNLFVMLILFLGLFAGSSFSMIMGLIVGITLDFMSGRVLGISAIMFCLVGILSGYIDKNFSKESKLTIMIMVIGTTIFYEVGHYLFSVVILEMTPEIKKFVKILIIEVLYNSILTIILYKLILKVGYKMEEFFKQKNILTRYF